MQRVQHTPSRRAAGSPPGTRPRPNSQVCVQLRGGAEGPTFPAPAPAAQGPSTAQRGASTPGQAGSAPWRQSLPRSHSPSCASGQLPNVVQLGRPSVQGRGPPCGERRRPERCPAAPAALLGAPLPSPPLTRPCSGSAAQSLLMPPRSAPLTPGHPSPPQS